MRVLLYKDLDTRRVQKTFAKVRRALESGDFRTPELKKLSPSPFWRAKLDDSNRLLLQFVRYGEETVCLLLEVIAHHAYDKSRFLRGAVVDFAKIEQAPAMESSVKVEAETCGLRLRWLPPERDRFELLDKPIVFDDAQEAVYRLPPPAVLLGPAGSGKTAVTLAKLREAEGRVLYVTQSAYLAQSARTLYAAHGYENEAQEAEFLSYREFLETLRVPAGREVRFADFRSWFERHRTALRGELREVDAHALFEEFRGVISAQPVGPFSLEAYQALGVRQSLIPAGPARELVHGLYGRYSAWMQEVGLFDLNGVAHAWRPLAKPVYDFVVIDEVQDLTNAQLALVLACLKKPGHFLLCGDAHQIVHPNFFSWAAVRALFWRGLASEAAAAQNVSVLQANFRNTQAVTQVANTLLKIKQARFGSVDRESSFLVSCASPEAGAVQLLASKDSTLRDLDARTRASVHHAVIVLRDEDKPAARAHFRTPLVFSMHEAKGLEYPHVILFSLISGQRSAFAEVCRDVTAAELVGDTLDYRRARDKADKALELYKFYVNALYVAMTRAVESLTLVESDTDHPLLDLLGLETGEALVLGAAQASSKEEWAQEARRLEQQGKEEQAQAIRETFLKSKAVPWSPWSETLMRELAPRALDPKDPSSKPRQALLDYALWHGQHHWIERLTETTGFPAARSLTPYGRVGGIPLNQGRSAEGADVPVLRATAALQERHLRPYAARHFKEVLAVCDEYGVDHRTPTGGTPLMMAARAGNRALVDALLERGADAEVTDEFGHTAWMAALSRAIDEPGFAKASIPGLFERLAPAALDVQTDERLVRLERHQAEYWILSLMLAGLKTQGVRAAARPFPLHRYERGFFADGLLATLSELPHHLWHEPRRKRTYINHVLARAEVDGTYLPARRLWVRIMNGYYLPNPLMQLRRRGSGKSETPGWHPIGAALNLTWILEGTDWAMLKGYVRAADRAIHSNNDGTTPTGDAVATGAPET